jgi:hypothetical protein
MTSTDSTIQATGPILISTMRMTFLNTFSVILGLITTTMPTFLEVSLAKTVKMEVVLEDLDFLQVLMMTISSRKDLAKGSEVASVQAPFQALRWVV